MHSRLFSLLALVCLSSALYAQKEKPENHQVYGGYSFLSNSLNGVPGARQGLNGFDAGIAFTPWHNLRFKIDTSAYRGTNLGAPQHPYFIMGGGQYNFRIGRETLFAEGLAGVGGANKNWGTGGSLSQTASFASFLGGGLDTPVTRHLALRVEGGFQYSYFALQSPKTLYPYRIPGLPTYFGRLSAGPVFEF
jgi:hypothetical protein